MNNPLTGEKMTRRELRLIAAAVRVNASRGSVAHLYEVVPGLRNVKVEGHLVILRIAWWRLLVPWWRRDIEMVLEFCRPTHVSYKLESSWPW